MAGTAGPTKLKFLDADFDCEYNFPVCIIYFPRTINVDYSFLEAIFSFWRVCACRFCLVGGNKFPTSRVRRISKSNDEWARDNNFIDTNTSE